MGFLFFLLLVGFYNWTFVSLSLSLSLSVYGAVLLVDHLAVIELSPIIYLTLTGWNTIGDANLDSTPIGAKDILSFSAPSDISQFAVCVYDFTLS